MQTDPETPIPFLLVEVDFDQKQHELLLRIYQVTGDQRRILRTQELFNLSQRLRKHLLEPPPGPEDAAIIKTIWPAVNRPHILKSNLQVLKISRDMFHRWLRSWERFPERIIERQTQAPYDTRPRRAKMHFELVPTGRDLRLKAVVSCAAGDFPYARVRQNFIPETDKIRIEQQIYSLKLPIARELLDRVFGRDNPRVPPEAIVEHLPTLLNHRLDLLRGSCIHEEKQIGRVRLRIVEKDNEIHLETRIGRAPMWANRTMRSYVLERDRQWGTFILTQFQGRKQEKILRSFLGLLPLTATGPGCYRLEDGHKHLNLLRKNLAELPAEIEQIISPELQTLFADETPLEAEIRIHPGKNWLDFSVVYLHNGTQLDTADVLNALYNTDAEDEVTIRDRNGHWIALNSVELIRLRQLFTDTGLAPGENRQVLATARQTLGKIQARTDLRLHQSGKKLAKKLLARPETPAIPLSPDLDAMLRPYQKDGANFLFNRTSYEVGCLLADDMGLGKTVQALACLRARRQEATAPSLIICPASVLRVWNREAAHATPLLRVQTLAGTPEQRREILRDIAQKDVRHTDVLLTTYALVRNDCANLEKIPFDTVILDEAQQIRNPDAAITRAIKRLQAQRRIALTGTPLENRILDIWSILDFLNPGLFGQREDWDGPTAHTPETRRRLARRLAPIMLRRTKQEVATELPPRIEEVLEVPMHPQQREVYEAELISARAQQKNGKNNMMPLLASITRLRQICCHPNLLPEDHRHWETAELAAASAKLDCLVNRLAELMAEGHSALVFSQFTSMLTLIRQRLMERTLPLFMLTGKTPTAQRGEIVQQFTDCPTPSTFLLSLRAAGTGLTLTRADYVFLFDPWWNPAVERQAIDRAHRIGQDKPVIAYRLVAADSVESRVLALQESKNELFRQVVDGAESSGSGLNAAELGELLR